MGKIIKLPDEVANRIAAGEVVERPASVVKELIENSLDANATYIEIFLNTGGKNLIIVNDNGEGMNEEDVLLSLQRHATSKLRSADELDSIATLGFRGEALPSIASVSMLEMVSRQRNADAGFRVLIDHNEIIEQGSVSAQAGTTVSVKNLFEKVPARRRFLKSDSSELSACVETITRLALSHPDDSFRVEADGREMMYLTACSGYRERIEQIFGAELAEQLDEIHYEAGDYSAFGYVGNRTIHRGRATDEYFFLNSRPIKSGLVAGALHRAFSGVLPPRRYPVAFLFIEAPPELVDVNVHPAKLEVRFRREEAVFGAIYKAVMQAIGEKPSPSAMPITLTTQQYVQQSRLDFPEPARPSPGKKIRPPTQMEREIVEALDTIEKGVSDNDEVKDAQAQFLQIHQSYIVLQTRDGMFILDQHAAHERVLYERVMLSVESEGMSGQRLLFPVDVKLAPQWITILAQLLEKFSAIGFEIEIADSDKAMIMSVPSFLRTGDYAAVFKEILGEVAEYYFDSPNVMKNFSATIACHSAIKAGQALTQDEMSALFDSLFACDDPFHCPHGRPTIIKFTLSDFEKMFGRKG